MAQASSRGTGRTTPRGTQPPPTSAKDWKAKTKGTELEVPSGNVCLVRMVGMDVFLKKGMVPNSLLPIISKAVGEGRPMQQGDIEITEQTLHDMLDMFDAVVCEVVIAPEVSPAPVYPEDWEDEDLRGHVIPIGSPDRDDDHLYVDEVDMEDKQFIFQFVVGGTRDLEQFRKQSGTALAGVLGGQDIPGAAVQPPGDT
jgi:hypothetical protein